MHRSSRTRTRSCRALGCASPPPSRLRSSSLRAAHPTTWLRSLRSFLLCASAPVAPRCLRRPPRPAPLRSSSLLLCRPLPSLWVRAAPPAVGEDPDATHVPAAPAPEADEKAAPLVEATFAPPSWVVFTMNILIVILVCIAVSAMMASAFGMPTVGVSCMVVFAQGGSGATSALALSKPTSRVRSCPS